MPVDGMSGRGGPVKGEEGVGVRGTTKGGDGSQ